ncbi:MAG: hypothetical protein U9N42_00115 [Campylobacterota bacterium]|nr:hypothetical protein [Campylobacterota bacterium]
MSLFLSTEVIVLLFLDAVVLLFAFVAFIASLSILKSWNFNSTLPLQYALERRNYLVSTITYFIVVIKVVLFLLFIFSIDSLASIIPGAMCGSGVINSNEYGINLLITKLFVLFLLTIWLNLNKLDLEATNYPFIHKKYLVFISAFVLILIEMLLELFYFSNISTTQPTLCCSVTFGVSSAISLLPAGLQTTTLLILFYLVFLLTILSNWFKYLNLSFVSNGLFLFLGYLSLTYFFGTYIYELPTHKCPFCMLQYEYNYIGYILWASLVIGTFFGMSNYVIEKLTKKKSHYMYNYSSIFNTIFVLCCTYFVLAYYARNGVFL